MPRYGVVVREATTRQHINRHIAIEIRVVKTIPQKGQQIGFFSFCKVKRSEERRKVSGRYPRVFSYAQIEVLNNLRERMLAAAVEVERRVLHIVDGGHLKPEHIFSLAGMPPRDQSCACGWEKDFEPPAPHTSR